MATIIHLATCAGERNPSALVTGARELQTSWIGRHPMSPLLPIRNRSRSGRLAIVRRSRVQNGYAQPGDHVRSGGAFCVSTVASAEISNTAEHRAARGTPVSGPSACGRAETPLHCNSASYQNRERSSWPYLWQETSPSRTS